MRAYYFGNMYLSSIQQGIQAAHATADMFVKYQSHNEEYQEAKDMLHDWAENHKTMILLNGGYSETIRGMLNFFEDNQNPYPFAPFYEGEDALDGALTTVGIILPEKIYTASALARKYRRTFKHKLSTLDEILETGELFVSAEDSPTGEAVTWEFSKWEYKLVALLNDFGLAS